MELGFFFWFSFLFAFGIGDFLCYVLFIYCFFGFIEAVQNQKCSFYLHAWKCNRVESVFLSYCQNINERLSFPRIMKWPKGSISWAGRLVHKTFALAVFIRLSSRPQLLFHIIRRQQKNSFLFGSARLYP